MVERKYKVTFTGGSQDMNVSVQNSLYYSRRFVKFVSSSISDEEN